MSGDLISRSALSKAICNKECEVPSFESVKELNIFLAGLNAKQIAVMECLGKAPTAYNVDKVVEQLEELKNESNMLTAKCSAYILAVGALRKAIEIVKAGVVK